MITVYTKDYCPYCVQAKNLLKSLNIDFTEVDVTNDSATLMKIVQKSRMRTVPQIFVGETCIGGYMDIAELHKQEKLISTIENLSK